MHVFWRLWGDRPALPCVRVPWRSWKRRSCYRRTQPKQRLSQGSTIPRALLPLASLQELSLGQNVPPHRSQELLFGGARFERKFRIKCVGLEIVIVLGVHRGGIGFPYPVFLKSFVPSRAPPEMPPQAPWRSQGPCRGPSEPMARVISSFPTVYGLVPGAGLNG